MTFLTFLPAGDDPENISLSGTEEETTDAEEGDEEEEASKQEEGQGALGKTTFIFSLVLTIKLNIFCSYLYLFMKPDRPILI